MCCSAMDSSHKDFFHCRLPTPVKDNSGSGPSGIASAQLQRQNARSFLVGLGLTAELSILTYSVRRQPLMKYVFLGPCFSGPLLLAGFDEADSTTATLGVE